MKKLLYPRLAWTGIAEQRLYVPYLLTCTGMGMMHYIINALSCSSVVYDLRAATPHAMLGFWQLIIALFSLISSSTQLLPDRRRMKEFGLYTFWAWAGQLARNPDLGDPHSAG